MTRYFAGNSLAAFSRTAPAVVEATTAGKFDSAYVPSSIKVQNSDYAQTPDFGPATGTVHFRFDANVRHQLNKS